MEDGNGVCSRGEKLFDFDGWPCNVYHYVSDDDTDFLCGEHASLWMKKLLRVAG